MQGFVSPAFDHSRRRRPSPCRRTAEFVPWTGRTLISAPTTSITTQGRRFEVLPSRLAEEYPTRRTTTSPGAKRELATPRPAAMPSRGPCPMTTCRSISTEPDICPLPSSPQDPAGRQRRAEAAIASSTPGGCTIPALAVPTEILIPLHETSQPPFYIFPPNSGFSPISQSAIGDRAAGGPTSSTNPVDEQLRLPRPRPPIRHERRTDSRSLRSFPCISRTARYSHRHHSTHLMPPDR